MQVQVYYGTHVCVIFYDTVVVGVNKRSTNKYRSSPIYTCIEDPK